MKINLSQPRPAQYGNTFICSDVSCVQPGPIQDTETHQCSGCQETHHDKPDQHISCKFTGCPSVLVNHHLAGDFRWSIPGIPAHTMMLSKICRFLLVYYLTLMFLSLLDAVLVPAGFQEVLHAIRKKLHWKKYPHLSNELELCYSAAVQLIILENCVA